MVIKKFNFILEDLDKWERLTVADALEATSFEVNFGIFDKNAQTSDQKHCDLSELPDIHSLDIVIFGPYALIFF